MFSRTGLVGLASLTWFVALVGGCSDAQSRDAAASASAAIVGGIPSTSEEDFVVHLLVPGGSNCGATLIAPNAVLTALHCVSEFDPTAAFTCNGDGTVSSIDEGGGLFGAAVTPESIEIRVGPAPLSDPASAYGSRVFGSGSDTICHGDLAVVVLDRNLAPSPRHIRLGKPVIRGDYETIIGYGQTESTSIGQRNHRTGLRALAVGAYGEYRAQGVAVDATFVLGQGVCHGDSGGPAIDEETGAVTGVASLLEDNNCVASQHSTFTQVAPFEAVIREALAFAGAEPLVEDDTGTGGAGGANGNDAGAGGQAEGGDANAPSHSGGSAGNAAGSDSADAGQGGEDGSGTPGPEGGSNAQGGNAQGGDAPGGSARGGTETTTGQAGSDDTLGTSRTTYTDAGCGCHLEATKAGHGRGWAGFLWLLVAAALRRRRS